MARELVIQAVVAAFGVLQLLVAAAIAAAFKTYLDVRDLKRDHGKDLNAAFTKIRALEETLASKTERDGRHG